MHKNKDRQRSAKYLAFVRSHPCVICGKKSDAHHLRFMQDRGTGLKVGDQFCVPICRLCHTENHSYGDETIWWALKGIDPVQLVVELQKEYAGHDQGDT